MNQNNNLNLDFLSEMSRESDVEQNYALFIQEAWKNNQVSFSRLPKISKYLKYLNSSAGTLYMLYVECAKNEKGSSFWSIKRLADTLGVSEKTITNSNTKLSDLGLIFRESNGKSSITTTLLPTESFLIQEPDEDIMHILDSNLYTLLKNKNLSIALSSTANKYINYYYYKLNKSSKYGDLDVYAILMLLETTPAAQGNIIHEQDIHNDDSGKMESFNLLSQGDKLTGKMLKTKLEILLRYLQ